MPSWSLTLYDREGFAVPNPLDRCTLGDRDALRHNDGSPDLVIQTQTPGPLNEPNRRPPEALLCAVRPRGCRDYDGDAVGMTHDGAESNAASSSPPAAVAAF